MANLNIINESLTSIEAPPATLDLLRDLHTQALTEPAYVSTDDQPESVALERFVALEPDKCAFVYLLLRATGARYVVEAGTSFGVSTIYLALAVAQNAAMQKGDGKVIATENEAVKANRARSHWKRAGDEVEKYIDLREGDLRETLKTDLPKSIDFLLLDIWTPLALPALKLVQPQLRPGATIVADNTDAAKKGYADLHAYVDDPQNLFKRTTLPYSGGLELITYLGN